MATLTVQNVSEAGLNPSFGAAASGGDQFKNDVDGRTFLVVKNGDVSAHTATITAQSTSLKVRGFGSLTKNDLQVSVPASGERWIGPLAEAFNDSGGNVQITYSAVTSVTVAAIKVPTVA